VVLTTLPPSVIRLSIQCVNLNISQPNMSPRPVTGIDFFTRSRTPIPRSPSPQIMFLLLSCKAGDTRALNVSVAGWSPLGWNYYTKISLGICSRAHYIWWWKGIQVVKHVYMNIHRQYRRADNSRPVSFTVSAWEWVTSLSPLQKETKERQREWEKNKQTARGRSTQCTNNSDPITSTSELLLR
jgi:hypothetical protein